MFEILYLRPHQIDDFSYIDQQLKKHDFKKNKTLILIAVWEKYEHRIIATHLKHVLDISELFNLDKIKFLLHESNRHYDLKDFNGRIEISYLDTFCYHTYYRSFYLNQRYSRKWNHNTDLGLLFLGKPMKLNRIGLLYELYQNDLLGKIRFSLYVPDHLITVTKEFAGKNVTDEKFDRFLLSTNNTKLDDPIYLVQETSMHFDGFPYAVDLFADTQYSIISETYFTGSVEDRDQIQFITEKTYKALINWHPFILAGNHMMLETLEKKGYKCFQEYLPVDYNQIIDNHDRLDCIVEMIEIFPDILKKNRGAVEKNLHHNFKKITKQGETITKQLREFFYNKPDQWIFSTIIENE